MPDAPLIKSGPNVLIMGPSGTGKTYSLGTLVDWASTRGREVFVLFTENGLETLLGYWSDRDKPIPDCLHWHTAHAKPLSFDSLMKAADAVGRFSYEAITKMTDPSRGGENNSFYKILAACTDFPDDRTGKKFGAVDSWETNRIFCIDSLSELSNASMKMTIGNKPTAAPPDYGVAQNNLMNFLRLLTQGCPATFVITAHVDRDKDELTGGTKIMVKAVGRALSSEIPQLFSDVILTVREGASFYWDTASAQADVKSRNLPIAAKQPPNFSAIMDKWVSRGGK